MADKSTGFGVGNSKGETTSNMGGVSPQRLPPRKSSRNEALQPPVEPRRGFTVAGRPSLKPTQMRSDRSDRESPKQAASPMNRPYAWAFGESLRRLLGGTSSPKTRGPRVETLGVSPEDTGVARTPKPGPPPTPRNAQNPTGPANGRPPPTLDEPSRKPRVAPVSNPGGPQSMTPGAGVSRKDTDTARTPSASPRPSTSPTPRNSHRVSGFTPVRFDREDPKQAALESAPGKLSRTVGESSRTPGAPQSPKTRRSLQSPDTGAGGASPENASSLGRHPTTSPEASGSKKPGTSLKSRGPRSPVPFSPQPSVSLSPANSPPRPDAPMKPGTPTKSVASAKPGQSPKSNGSPRPIVPSLPVRTSRASTPVSLRSVDALDNIGGATPSYAVPTLQRVVVSGGKGQPSGRSTPSPSRVPPRSILRGEDKALSPAEELRASHLGTRSPTRQPRWHTPTDTEMPSPPVVYEDPGRNKAPSSPARAHRPRNRRHLTMILLVCTCTIVLGTLALIIALQFLKVRKFRGSALTSTSSSPASERAGTDAPH